jgi:micrococcal nuclease
MKSPGQHLFRFRVGRALPAVVALAVLVACGSPSPPISVRNTPPATSPAGLFVKARVVEVYDGDSIVVHLPEGRDVNVHLIGVDAPDSNQPFRGRASAFTRGLLKKGHTVFLEPGPGAWDSQNRYLGYMWLSMPVKSDVAEAPTRMLNAILLLKGFAHIERETANPKYAARFESLEASAKRAHRNIWS